MGRLHTIVEKLNKELEEGASKQQLIHTSKMLLLELESMIESSVEGEQRSAIAVNTVEPIVTKEERIEIEEKLQEELAPEPLKEVSKAPSYDELEKEFSILSLDENEVAAELEMLGNSNIPKKTDKTTSKSGSNILLFDPIDDIPTLTHQSQQPEFTVSELNEKMRTTDAKPSINDVLKNETNELSSSLSNEPIKDLKKGIGVNDTYLFINELFRGDESMYTRSIKTINGFSNFAEAQFWIERELKLKLGWSNSQEVVRHFDQLIRRRFS